MTLVRSVSNMMRSASLPGVSEPVLASRPLAPCALDRRHRHYVLDGEQGRQQLLALDRTLVEFGSPTLGSSDSTMAFRKRMRPSRALGACASAARAWRPKAPASPPAATPTTTSRRDTDSTTCAPRPRGSPLILCSCPTRPLLRLRGAFRLPDDVFGRCERGRNQGRDGFAGLRRDFKPHGLGFFEERRVLHGRIERAAQRFDTIG